jgi:outer membrane protein assembly factor BamB
MKPTFIALLALCLPLVGAEKKPGTILWEFKTGESSWGVDSSPAIGTDGTVYFGSDDHKVYALDGKTGAKKWEFVTGGGVDSSPIIGPDGTVYIGSGKIYALNGKTGAKIWESKPGASLPSCIGADGTVYLGGETGGMFTLCMV